ncbi:Hypothetical predicted protein [Mytilus galloprovincialis]|uniref:Uncharacterized protein n=1 Tax=Mytilus galloprovincialis TaxID=29158 RepID=A0A8B6BKV1_MYTGA|nr:Hypothetical predicted protein [Mytilus galloprovincialis]
MSDSSKIEQGLRTHVSCVNRDLFAYKVNKNDLFKKINQRALCGSMAILSSHNNNVMYIPMHLMYPSLLKKTLYFPSHKPSSKNSKEKFYDCEPLASYAVVVSNTNLKAEINTTYRKVYHDETIKQDGVDTPFPMEDMTLLMDKFDKSDQNNCSDSPDEKAFRSEYIDIDNTGQDDNNKYLEDILQDDEAFVVYLTEAKLFKHGMNEEFQPFVFRDAIQLTETDSHIPNTIATQMYGCGEDYGEKPFVLKSSAAILQDMIEFISISLCLADTFEDLFDFCKHMYSIKSKKVNYEDASPDKDNANQINGVKIAIGLRMIQEYTADLTNSASVNSSYFTGNNPLSIHKLYLNMLMGDKTGMNCVFPKSINIGNKSHCKYEKFAASAFQGLKNFTLHSSKTYTLFALSLMFLMMKKTNKQKYMLMVMVTCKRCNSIYCCNRLCNRYNLESAQKDSSGKDNTVTDGFANLATTEFNGPECFVGNASAAAEGDNEMERSVAPGFIHAAELTAQQFGSFSLTGTKESNHIEQMLNKISALMTYIDTEQHGIPLVNRNSKSTKLETEMKEPIKPCVGYLGTCFMGIRKSSTLRLMSLLAMVNDKDILFSQYDNYKCMVTGFLHGSYLNMMPNIGKPILTEKLVIVSEKNQMGEILIASGQTMFTETRINPCALKASNKVKSVSSYFSTNSGPEQLSYGSISQEVTQMADLLLLKIVLPNLLQGSPNVKKSKLTRLKLECKRDKIQTFLALHPCFATVLSQIDNNNLSITSWDSFVDVFIAHYLLNKYGYQPYETKRNWGSGGDDVKESVPGKHKLLSLVKMCDDGSSIDFQARFIDKDLFTAAVLLSSTRVTLGYFLSKKNSSIIYYFKNAESTSKSCTGITDMFIYATSIHTAFVTILKDPYVTVKAFELPTWINEMISLSPEQQLKSINTNASKIYDAIVQAMGFGNEEGEESTQFLKSTHTEQLVKSLDKNKIILSNECVLAAINNVIDNFKHNNTLYLASYDALMVQLSNNMEQDDVEDLDDNSEEEENEEEETDEEDEGADEGKKRKRKSGKNDERSKKIKADDGFSDV